MSLVQKCYYCERLFNTSDVIATRTCGGCFHYHCTLKRDSCLFQCGCENDYCFIEKIEVLTYTQKFLEQLKLKETELAKFSQNFSKQEDSNLQNQKSSESQASLEEIKLIKTELAKFSQNISKQEKRQDQLELSTKKLSEDNNRRFNELKAQIELSSQNICDLQKRLNDREQTIEFLQKANAKLELSSMETNELQGQLNERDKMVEALSKENAQLKRSSNTSELYKRLVDYETTIDSLKQELAQLKLSSTNKSDRAQCSQEIEKTVASSVKSNVHKSTPQEILLCELNATLKNPLCLQEVLDGSSKRDQSMQKSSNELNIQPEENANKRFMQLEAQLAESNKNLIELQKRVNGMEQIKINANIPNQSANEHNRENTANNQYMFQDFKILLQNSSSDMGNNNTTGNNKKWTHNDEPQYGAEAKYVIAMKDRIIQESLQELKDKSWELTVEKMKLPQYLFYENLPKNARN